jgi:hypothetical protein
LIAKDIDTGEEEFSTARACVFDTNNWHCSLGNNTFTSWSLRIDGSFNPEWARKIGIAGHYNL